MTIFTSPTESKRLAIELRKKGYSYSEIAERVSIPKSTLAVWLRRLKLTDLQKERLRQKRLLASRRGGQKKSERTESAIREIQTSSARQIKNISKRELWLMGLMLYYRERTVSGIKEDIKKGVSFMSSDPLLVTFFIHWLKDVGKLNDDDFLYDIFLSQKDKNASALYWAKFLKISKNKLTRFYVLKKKGRKTLYKNKDSKTPFGILKIRVRASSMLGRQISGWIKGISTTLLSRTFL